MSTTAPSAEGTRPRIKIYACGGTIAMTGGSEGVTPGLTGEQLVSQIPELEESSFVDVAQFRQVPSCYLTLRDVIELSFDIRRALATGVDGIVVIQGTDTIEETSFALDLLIDDGAPIVVTGAMRNPTLYGADGRANLLAAVRVAGSDCARGRGTTVVLEETIHAARYVAKADTMSLSAFSSGIHGIVGRVVEGRISLINHPAPLPKVLLSEAPDREARIGLVTACLGDDGALIDAAQVAGYDGLVVEAMGVGHVPPAMADALERVSRSMPVVLASRTGQGEVFQATYAYPGGEIDLCRRGVIRAGWLPGLKARVLLALLVTAGIQIQRIRETFGAFGGGRDR